MDNTKCWMHRNVIKIIFRGLVLTLSSGLSKDFWTSKGLYSTLTQYNLPTPSKIDEQRAPRFLKFISTPSVGKNF